MKPKTTEAMQQLVERIRAEIPFHLDEAHLCSGICIGCSKKLLEFLHNEVSGWETALSKGQVPKLGDINKLAKMSLKIYRVLQRNNLIQSSENPQRKQ